MSATPEPCPDEATETGAPRRPGRPRDPNADEVIIEAAIEVVRDQGFSGFTVESVAARAGVGKATIYRRWATREDLVQQVAARFMEPVEIPDTGSVRADLIEWYWGRYKHKQVGRDNRLMGQVLVEASVNPDMHRMVRAFSADRHTSLAKIVDRATERGELDADVDGRLVLDLLSGALLYRSLFQDDPITVTLVEQLVDMVLATSTLA